MRDEWLSTGQVASLLGVSRQHVVDLCDRGDLAHARFGKHRRIRNADLNQMTEPRLTREQERSLWLHRAVLGELAVDPHAVLATAGRNLARWKAAHRPDGMTARYLGDWETVIGKGADAVARVLVGLDPASTELRQNSPFAGVLSEAKRTRVLESFRRDAGTAS